MSACIKNYACGTASLSVSDGSAADFSKKINKTAEELGGAFAFIFHSGQLFDPQELADALAEHAPNVEHAGCTTAGEITADGLQEGQAVAILMSARNFTVKSTIIEDVDHAGMDVITALVEQSRREIYRAEKRENTRLFAVCLIDGMCYAEERITSAIHWGLDDVPLLGGSAGDDLNFGETIITHNGHAYNKAAAIALVATDVPFRVFKTDNFVPSNKKLVVTASDPDHRIVQELNAASAASEYAIAIGLDEKCLSPLSFATHPVVVRVGGEYYCRSIQKMNEDGSLSFFCAIDTGIVLTIAEPTSMVETTRATLDHVSDHLQGAEMILGFECILRRLDAQNHQITGEVSELYKNNNLIGFSTYGEQFRSMHLNQTLTGIAFGKAPRQGSDS